MFVVDKLKPTFIDNAHNRIATSQEDQISSYVRGWYKFLGKTEYLHSRSMIQFSAEMLCLKLINLSYLGSSHRYKVGYFAQFGILAAFVHALLPGLIREYEAATDGTGNHFFGSTWFSVAFVVIGILMSVVFFFTNFMFVVCALTDVRRQYHLLVQAGRLIRPYSRANKQYLPSTSFADYKAARHKKEDRFDMSPRSEVAPTAAATTTPDNVELVPPADFTRLTVITRICRGRIHSRIWTWAYRKTCGGGCTLALYCTILGSVTGTDCVFASQWRLL